MATWFGLAAGKTQDASLAMCASTPSLSQAHCPAYYCSFPAWYTIFQAHSLRSVILPLPPGFLSFLAEDGIFIGDESQAVRTAQLIGGPDETSLIIIITFLHPPPHSCHVVAPLTQQMTTEIGRRRRRRACIQAAAVAATRGGRVGGAPMISCTCSLTWLPPSRAHCNCSGAVLCPS